MIMFWIAMLNQSPLRSFLNIFLPTPVISTNLLNVASNKTKNHRVSVCAQKHMLVTVGNVSKIFDR